MLYSELRFVSHMSSTWGVQSVDVFSPKCSVQEPCTSLDSLLTSHALWHKITVSTSSREMGTENQRHMSNIPQTASAAANVSWCE